MVKETAAAHPGKPDAVMGVLFDERTEAVYQAEVKKYGSRS